MKLIVQIPCHNEASTLGDTIAAVPRRIEGVDSVEILVIDDGSDDGTARVAREQGADHVLRSPRRRGLAGAFKAGIDAALRLGADVIVNTDGDNQYDGAQIPRLVAPILAGEADMTVGDRDPGSLEHFSWLKRRLQRLGSWAMRRLSGTRVADSTSGFRGYSRESALRINVMTDFTYTLETLIQAGQRRLKIVDVPVRARLTSRASRLAPSMAHYLTQAGLAMARAYALYRPLKVFTVLGLVLTLGGVLLGVRFLYLWLNGQGQGNVQSLILAAILVIVGFQTLCLGLLSDLLAGNRKLMEEILYRQRRDEADGASAAVGKSAGVDGRESVADEGAHPGPARPISSIVEEAAPEEGAASAGGVGDRAGPEAGASTRGVGGRVESVGAATVEPGPGDELG